MNARENWNFTVVGCDSHNTPKYLGFVQTREEAVTLKENMESIGWQRVAIFDAALQEQVEKKDKQIAYLEELLKRQQGQGYGRG